MTGRGGRGAGAFSEPFGLLTPQHGLAIQARRRMHEYGTTSRQFGMVAVTEREHANRNPRATFYDTPLTIDDHQDSRIIVDPFHLFDCCLETDGGGALVLTSAVRARDLRQPAAIIRTAAQAGFSHDREYVDTTALALAPRLWKQARLRPDEVDVVQIYDHFAPFVIFALEDYGFVPRGEGGEFVADGRIRWDARGIPVNTSGGHLSEAYMQGMNHLLEAVRQVRGTSTAQVPDAHYSFRRHWDWDRCGNLREEPVVVVDLPMPVPEPENQPFWDALATGELWVQSCADCGTMRHPPRPMCADCQSMAVDWVALSGAGHVYSYIVLVPGDPPRPWSASSRSQPCSWSLMKDRDSSAI